MFCSKCGVQNEGNALHCVSCGAALHNVVITTPVRSVPNHLVWAILATFLCCVPLGIPAIIYAAQVDGKLACGDYTGAVNASNNARLFSWIAFGIGFVTSLIWVTLMLIGALCGHS
jgi:hypothetical protein